MTNKEIKLELAKVALATCRHMTSESLTESLKNLYEWVIEEPEVEEVPVVASQQRLKQYSTETTSIQLVI